MPVTCGLAWRHARNLRDVGVSYCLSSRDISVVFYAFFSGSSQSTNISKGASASCFTRFIISVFYLLFVVVDLRACQEGHSVVAVT